jgi:nucleotide-binding universal stress UspA family protein
MSGMVLCAIDASQSEHEAPVLRRAAQIAQLDGGRLDVISVVPSYHNSLVGGYFGPEFHDRVVADTRKALSAFVEEVLGAEANADVRHVVATGNVYEEVLKTAEVDGANVIVIGSHRPALQDYLLGPNAGHVVRHAKCSVFVVR